MKSQNIPNGTGSYTSNGTGARASNNTGPKNINSTLPKTAAPAAQIVQASKNAAPLRFKLSLIVPVFNEERTLSKVVAALTALNIGADLEILFVNDGSSDRSGAILDAVNDPRVRVLHRPQNNGKGSAVLDGIAHASGTHMLIFDADEEYSSKDIAPLVAPIIAGRAEVVYGVRLRGVHTVHPSLVHALGNLTMTWSANLLFGCAISDLHTCLKLLPLPLVRDMQLKERGFGLDTEITTEMLRKGFRPYEIPASYVGRSKEEGKKIKATDAVRCFVVMFKVRLRGTTRPGLRNQGLAPRTTA